VESDAPLESAGFASLLDELSPLDVGAPEETVARRSFFAQPDPLKCTAGALIALRMGPLPQMGQTVGRSAWRP
jgi:hypothetical protein